MTEIQKLRVSIARIAQAIGVNGSDGLSTFTVTQDMGYGDLCTLAETHERGWNDLCYQIVERARELTE